MVKRKRIKRYLSAPQSILDFDVQLLEHRQLLATFTVSNLGDGEVTAPGDQPGTLRQAVFDANANPGADTIEFDLGTQSSGTIRLTSGFIRITDDVSINGLGEHSLVVDAQNQSSAFALSSAEVAINDLSIVNGYNAYSGGAISAFGSALTLANVTISGSSSLGSGGAIYGDATSSVRLLDSALANNDAVRAGALSASNVELVSSNVVENTSEILGGGIFARGSLSLVDTRVQGNRTSGSAGGIASTGDTTILRSRISNNVAYFDGGLQITGDGSSQISDSRIEGNQASVRGGGLALLPNGGAIQISGTVISGNRLEQPGDGELKGAGIYIQSNNSQITLQDSTVSGNEVVEDGDFIDRHGGGIYFRSGTSYNDEGSFLTIRNTDIENNQAAFGGGIRASLDELDRLDIENTRIVHNSGRLGGGVAVLASGADGFNLIDSTVAFNSAEFGGGVWGVFDDTSIRIRESRFTANLSAQEGGGGNLDLSGSSLVEIVDSEFVGNDASNGGNGGGLYLEGGSRTDVEIIDSSFNGNRGKNGGAIFSRSNGTLNMVESELRDNLATAFGGGLNLSGSGQFYVDSTTISGNRAAEGDGGGIAAEDDFGGMLVVSNSTISQNSANQAGGILVRSSEDALLSVLNSTISGNSAWSQGGGVSFRALNSNASASFLSSTIYQNRVRQTGRAGAGVALIDADASFNNTIVAGNISDDAPDVFLTNDASLSFTQYNLFGVQPNAVLDDTNLSGTAATPLDPRLAPLADNGGPTLTHALLNDSPAINMGSPEGELVTALQFDQRGAGFARILEGITDMGAFESGDNVSFVAVDRRSDDSFEYGNDGSLLESQSLSSDNRNPTGIAIVGSSTFVVDRNDRVYEYDEAGQLVGSRELDDLRSPEGITSNGTDLWIVDRSRDRVYFYENGVNQPSDSGLATSSFALDADNRQAMGITFGVLDGEAYLWVVDDRGLDRTGLPLSNGWNSGR